MSAKTVRTVGALVVVGVAFVLIEIFVDLPSAQSTQSFFDDLGWVRVPVFVAGYALATLLPLPKAVCTIVGGAIFGLVVGTVLVLIGAIIGSTGAFSIARWLGREPVRGITAGRVARLDEEVGRRGFVTVLIARLVPLVPFTTINYVFGLTSVTPRSYVAATAIGIIPGTVIYAAVGAYGFSPGSWPFIVAVVGLVALSVAGVVRSRRHRGDVSGEVSGDVSGVTSGDAV